MTQVVRLRLDVDITTISSLRAISECVIAEIVSPEDVTACDINEAYVFTTNPLDVTKAIDVVSTLLSVRQLHRSLEPFELNPNVIFRYESRWETPLRLSSIQQMHEVIRPQLALQIIPRSTFLDLELTDETIQFYCESHNTDPVWSLFFPQLTKFKNAIGELPKDNSWYKNDNMHPLIVKILNSVVRAVPDYLCLIEVVKGRRIETLERIPIFAYVSSNISLLSKIILNDYGVS